MTNSENVILELVDLRKHYVSEPGLLARALGQGRKPVLAVDGVSLALAKGETLGLVGESGCGKSTLGRTTLFLEEPTSGRVVLDGIDLTSLSPRELRRMRGRMQIVFQDPASSLNPRKTIRSILNTPIELWRSWDVRTGAEELIELVGLPRDSLSRHPHQFSGGQKQRIAVARALASRPELLIADEPVASLDVSVQAHIIRLLMDLQQRFGLSYLFISHDLNVVRSVSDRIAVMYLGKVVELGGAGDVVDSPLHPYTRALVSAIPTADRGGARIVITGEVPDPANPPAGCRFHPRCFMDRVPECFCEEPKLEEAGSGRLVACHLVGR